MKKGLLKRIGKGVINGIPLVQTIASAIKPEQPIAPGQIAPVKKIDWLVVLAEVATVGAVIALCFKVITFEQLKELLEILN